MSKLTALLDTNIQLSRSTHKWAYTQYTERRNHRVTTWIEEHPEPRTLRNKTLEQSSSIYDSLERIGRMARGGLLTLYESDETLAEFLNFRPAGFGLGRFDLFRDVKIQHVRAPLPRGFRIDMDYTPDRAREAFHVFLSQIRHPRYLKLLKRTGGAHKADLYHVWEAEHNELDAFITLDEKFVNAVSKPKPIDTPVKICTPLQFLEWTSHPQLVSK